MKIPILKAHAGCDGTAPNTLDYIKTSIQLGAEIIELDIQITKDDEVVAWHDDTVEGRNIAKTNWAELQRLKPEMLLLETAFLYLQDYNVLLNLDFKTLDLCEKVKFLIKKYQMEKRVVLTGVQFEDMRAVQTFFPDINVWVSTEYARGTLREDKLLEYTKRNVEKALKQKCSDINVFYLDCSKELVELAHQNNIRVHVWTVDQETDMRQMIAMKVDSIATNNIRCWNKIMISLMAQPG